MSNFATRLSHRNLVQTPLFVLNSFILVASEFKSLIHFELILVEDEKRGSSLNFLIVDVQSLQHHLLKRCHFLKSAQHMCFCICGNHLAVDKGEFLGSPFCPNGLCVFLKCQHRAVWVSVSLYFYACSRAHRC